MANNGTNAPSFQVLDLGSNQVFWVSNLSVHFAGESSMSGGFDLYATNGINYTRFMVPDDPGADYTVYLPRASGSLVISNEHLTDLSDGTLTGSKVDANSSSSAGVVALAGAGNESNPAQPDEKARATQGGPIAHCLMKHGDGPPTSVSRRFQAR